MYDPAFQFEREKIENEARETYNKIGHVWSPVLNGHISFKSAGFRHLMWKGGKRRPYTQQIKRLSLIAYAAKIVSDPKARVIEREEMRDSPIKRAGVKIIIKAPVRFWAFHANIERKNIRVIVRQVSNGSKHFFSIFEEEK